MTRNVVQAGRAAVAGLAFLTATLAATPPAEAVCCFASAPTRSACISLQNEYDRYYTIVSPCSYIVIGGIGKWQFVYRR